jgi:deoxyribonuclease-4
MKFGAHLSIAKGLNGVVTETDAIGGNAVQIFARNPRGRGETKIPAEDAKAFRELLKERGWTLVIHAPYYVNIGSGVDRNRKIAVEVAAADLEKADFIGAEYVVVHMGTPGDGHELEDCTKLAIKAVKDALKKAPKSKAMLLLETGAGPTRVGGSFEQLSAILKGVNSKRVGVCIDTAHMYLAGYDLRGKGMKKVLDEFDKKVGLKHVKVIHVNDTQSALGSGHDRHYHLGKGTIGIDAYKVMMADKRLKDKIFILETPKEDKDSGIGDEPDKKNLALIKKFAKAK